MTDIFTPERLANETREEYAARRIQARAELKTMTIGPTQAPAVTALDTSRFFLGQHTNGRKNAHRHAKRLVKTTNSGQNPKFPEDRKHTQHVHPLRDERGDAFTVVGKARIPGDASTRRIWLAGVSAQRGW